MKNNSNSKNTILQCALELFAERGYEAVSVSEIVQKAGVTKPTLYYFFESKEGVYKSILDDKYNLFNNSLKSVAIYHSNPTQYFEDIYPVLLRITNLYFDFYKENKVFYLMILSCMYAPPTSHTWNMVKDYSKIQYDLITDLFYQISSVHTNLKDKEHQLALTFIAVINSNISYADKNSSILLDNDKAHNIVHQFMHGVFA